MPGMLRNWYLQEIRDQIRVTDIEFPSGWIRFLKSLGLPLIEGTSAKRLIDWKKVRPRFETRYDLVSHERLITDGLSMSALTTHSEVLMDYGYHDPVISVPVRFFIVNWFKLVAATHFMGAVVVTPDGTLFMEFTDDAEFLLMSNFRIVSGSTAAKKAVTV